MDENVREKIRQVQKELDVFDSFIGELEIIKERVEIKLGELEEELEYDEV